MFPPSTPVTALESWTEVVCVVLCVGYRGLWRSVLLLSLCDVMWCYLGLPHVLVADVSGHRALCSACINHIIVQSVTSTTIASRAFFVTVPLIWNSLPDNIISAESLSALERYLFRQSLPGFHYWHSTPPVDLAVAKHNNRHKYRSDTTIALARIKPLPVFGHHLEFRDEEITSEGWHGDR